MGTAPGRAMPFPAMFLEPSLDKVTRNMDGNRPWKGHAIPSHVLGTFVGQGCQEHGWECPSPSMFVRVLAFLLHSPLTTQVRPHRPTTNYSPLPTQVRHHRSLQHTAQHAAAAAVGRVRGHTQQRVPKVLRELEP